MNTEKGIGLFGGTFNPVHLGHLRAAEEVRIAFGLVKVIFMVSALPPHKDPTRIAKADHRYAMTRLAIQGNSHFEVSDYEMKKTGVSYSIDTVAWMKKNYPGELFFIVGLDAFREIATWHRYDELLSLCHFVIMTRPGYHRFDLEDVLPSSIAHMYGYDRRHDSYIHPSGQKIFHQSVTLMDISSTNIRELIYERRSIRYLIPLAVEDYIEEHQLYRLEKRLPRS
jgi:nicotinate-nucleotide adenylyltransferase